MTKLWEVVFFNSSYIYIIDKGTRGVNIRGAVEKSIGRPINWPKNTKDSRKISIFFPWGRGIYMWRKWRWGKRSFGKLLKLVMISFSIVNIKSDT